MDEMEKTIHKHINNPKISSIKNMKKSNKSFIYKLSLILMQSTLLVVLVYEAMKLDAFLVVVSGTALILTVMLYEMTHGEIERF